MTTYQFKMVNGKLVELTSDEITALEARDAAWDASMPARAAEETRLTQFKLDSASADLAQRLANATSDQIDAYFAANVTNAASAIAVLKALVKLLAWRL